MYMRTLLYPYVPCTRGHSYTLVPCTRGRSYPCIMYARTLLQALYTHCTRADRLRGVTMYVYAQDRTFRIYTTVIRGTMYAPQGAVLDGFNGS